MSQLEMSGLDHKTEKRSSSQQLVFCHRELEGTPITGLILLSWFEVFFSILSSQAKDLRFFHSGIFVTMEKNGGLPLRQATIFT